MYARQRTRVLVPLLAVLLAASACGGDKDSAAATVNDVVSALDTGTPDYTCEYIPSGARCWLVTEGADRAINIGITSETGDPDEPVAAIFGGVAADPETIRTVADTLGVPIDDSLWIGSVGFTYSNPGVSNP